MPNTPCCNWWCSFWCRNLYNECLGCVYVDCVNCGCSNPTHSITPGDGALIPGQCKYPPTHGGGGSWDPEEFDPSQYTPDSCGEGGEEPIPMGLMAQPRRTPLGKDTDESFKFFVWFDPAAKPLRDMMKANDFRDAFHAFVRKGRPEAACMTAQDFAAFIATHDRAMQLRSVLRSPSVSLALSHHHHDQDARRVAKQKRDHKG
jgi:hypothetical protein